MDMDKYTQKNKNYDTGYGYKTNINNNNTIPTYTNTNTNMMTSAITTTTTTATTMANNHNNNNNSNSNALNYHYHHNRTNSGNSNNDATVKRSNSADHTGNLHRNSLSQSLNHTRAPTVNSRERGSSRINQEIIAQKWKLDKIPQYQIDDKGYIHFEKGLLVNNRYVLKESLGRGTFSKVFESIDLTDGKPVALKVIRNTTRYIEAAKMELKILQHITNLDDRSSSCIHLRDYFSWNDHPCFVFKLCGPSIYAIMSKNGYRPFPDEIVRDLSIQICEAVQFLHELDIIFTDLKPENIVFVDGRTKAVTSAGNKTIYYPLDTRVKIVDFGSAVYEPKYDPNNKATWKFRNGYNYLIQTRHYRAPEVVLEMHWKRPVDIWSIGCVILEFLHGSMVFNTHCPIDHLNQMQSMIGPMPEKLIQCAVPTKFEELFHRDMSLRMEDAKRSRVQARSLETYFNFNKPEHVDLYDLIKRMLRWFAADRITADEIMQHRYWITSDPSPQSPSKEIVESMQTPASLIQQQQQSTHQMQQPTSLQSQEKGGKLSTNSSIPSHSTNSNMNNRIKYPEYSEIDYPEHKSGF